MWRLLVPVLIVATAAGTANAHARLTAPVPRNDFDDIKDTNALHPPPCGGPRSTTVMSQPTGNTIQVAWDETIDHPGHYEILFSMASDLNFAFLNDPAGVTLNNIADVQGGTLPHHYTQMVKLPSTPCPACTLQVKQYMQDVGYYMSCADMELTVAPAASPGPVATAPSDDGGVPPDLSQAAAMPTAPTDSSPAPSAAPADDPGTPPPPDLAAPAIGPTQYDYRYGCSTVPGGAPTSPLWIFFALSVLGIARIAARSRYR